MFKCQNVKCLNFKYFLSKFSGIVEEIFLHKNAKFHEKTIVCSKVMNILAKKLKNATNKHVNKPV